MKLICCACSHGRLFQGSGRSYNCLRARSFTGEKVPEVGDWRCFALFGQRLSHPDAAVCGPTQAGAAEAKLAPAVVILTVVSGGRRLTQAEEVVVGVELTHVADGFSRRNVTWRVGK